MAYSSVSAFLLYNKVSMYVKSYSILVVLHLILNDCALWFVSSGALERQARLRDLGVQKLLQQLLSTNDTTLFDKYVSLQLVISTDRIRRIGGSNIFTGICLPVHTIEGYRSFWSHIPSMSLVSAPSGGRGCTSIPAGRSQ